MGGYFFFNDTATTEIYTLSLHDALPIYSDGESERRIGEVLEEIGGLPEGRVLASKADRDLTTRDFSGEQMRRSVERSLRRSEEHTSELQSRQYLVCRLLLEKKKIISSLS